VRRPDRALTTQARILGRQAPAGGYIAVDDERPFGANVCCFKFGKDAGPVLRP